ncbi:MAG: hypothetical protein ACJA0Q_000959 [Saprospiraceae bacterium]|jgi:hypothetical protein
MRKLMLSLTILFGSFGTCISQESLEEDDNSFFGSFIMSRGYSSVLNYVRIQPQFSHTYISVTSDDELTLHNISNDMMGLNLFGFHYGMRKNLVEMSNNKTFSLGIYPAIKASLFVLRSELLEDDGFAFGEFNVPVLFEWNYGNVAGWDSDKNKGFVFGAGLDFRYSGLLFMEGERSDFKTAYVTSLFKLGYRYWSAEDHAREFSLKIGTGFTSDNYPSTSNDDVNRITVDNNKDYPLRAFTAEFVWTTFFNY